MANATTAGSAGTLYVRTRLSIMMFLQYAIWGAWLPILYPFISGHRKFSDGEVSAVFAAGAAGAILGPFVAGQLADRRFATERMLAASHLVGAGLVWFLAGTSDFWPFVLISGLYGLIYAPTLALTNSLAFAHLPNRDQDFGPVRMWGTVGWIVVGILVGHILLRWHTPEGAAPAEVEAAQNAGRAVAFKVSAVLGVVMAAFCMTLPHTPPSPAPRKASAVAEALGEIRLQPLMLLFAIAVPVSMVHQFHFVHTAGFLSKLQGNPAADGFVKWVNGILGVGGGGLMTIGQMSEIAVLVAMPALAAALSRKWLLLIGLAAYAARMAIFAYMGDSVPMVMAGLALHGLCFGCFIFVAFMIVDENTSPDVRATAQNLFNLVIVGIGIIVGSWFAGSVVAPWAKAGGEMDFTKLFSVPMWMAIGCFAVMLIGYPGGTPRRSPSA
jgi:nucleoside transporter